MMAIAVWPSALPQRVLVDGYSERLRESRVVAQTDVGPPKVRYRGRGLKMIDGSLHVTYSQKSTLEYFFEETLQDGALPFVIPDQTHDGLPLTDEFGNILTDEFGRRLLMTSNWVVRFGEPPAFSPFACDFIAALSLQVYP